MNYFWFLVLGLVSGVLSGVFGIGGGIIIIPALIYIFGLTQLQAQGTTLALMVPPIGILAAMAYYKQGHVNLMVALFICIGFVFGGWFGSKIAMGLSAVVLRKAFGVLLFVTSIHMFFRK